jgi:Uncharacterised nucleotidyltransferase
MDLSPEWRLLLACARAKLSANDFHCIAELASADLDWQQIVTASYAHGIAPLIYYTLQQSGVIRLLPAAAAQTLRTSYYGNVARNSLLYDQLRNVLKAFGDEKIEVIVLKGAALAKTVYSNRALRPMSDIDILVREIDLPQVETKLLDLAYKFDANTKEHRRKHDYHFVFTKSGDIKIEIHWHITRPTSPFRIDIDGMWKRAQPTKIAGVEALVFSPEDLLLHLCQHMHKHKLIGGIRPLCDIAHVVEYHNAINWIEFGQRSSQWGISAYVYLALYLAKELLGANIPSSFLNDFEPAGFDRAVIQWAKERLLACESSPISLNLVQLCWKDHRLRDRLAALGGALAPKVVAKSYGLSQDSKRVPLRYYPLRIKYLLTRYGPLLWQLMSGDQKTKVVLAHEDNQLRLTNWLSSGYQQDNANEEKHNRLLAGH